MGVTQEEFREIFRTWGQWEIQLSIRTLRHHLESPLPYMLKYDEGQLTPRQRRVCIASIDWIHNDPEGFKITTDEMFLVELVRKRQEIEEEECRWT